VPSVAHVPRYCFQSTASPVSSKRNQEKKKYITTPFIETIWAICKVNMLLTFVAKFAPRSAEAFGRAVNVVVRCCFILFLLVT